MSTTPTLSDLSELFPAAGEWQETDYFPLAEKGRLVELSDGNIEVVELPTDFHQLILLRLSLLLHSYVASNKLGQVRFAPLPVRLWQGKIREPDLMYMSGANAGRIAAVWGVPDLAVEILSPGTEATDRKTKRIEYAMAGVVEYWIVDPVTRTIEVLSVPSRSGEWQSAMLYASPASLVSALFPGFSVDLDSIFSTAV